MYKLNPNILANKIQKQLLKLNVNKDIQQINHEIHLSHNDLSVKIANSQKLAESVKKRIIPVKYFKAAALPFKVISVDIWNGVPYATITIDKKSKLVGKNETGHFRPIMNFFYCWTAFHRDPYFVLSSDLNQVYRK